MLWAHAGSKSEWTKYTPPNQGRYRTLSNTIPSWSIVSSWCWSRSQGSPNSVCKCKYYSLLVWVATQTIVHWLQGISYVEYTCSSINMQQKIARIKAISPIMQNTGKAPAIKVVFQKHLWSKVGQHTLAMCPLSLQYTLTIYECSCCADSVIVLMVLPPL